MKTLNYLTEFDFSRWYATRILKTKKTGKMEETSTFLKLLRQWEIASWNELLLSLNENHGIQKTFIMWDSDGSNGNTLNWNFRLYLRVAACAILSYNKCEHPLPLYHISLFWAKQKVTNPRNGGLSCFSMSGRKSIKRFCMSGSLALLLCCWFLSLCVLTIFFKLKFHINALVAICLYL